MFEITEDGGFAQFKSKILNLRNEQRRGWSCLNCIGHGHKTLSFKIDDNGSIDIVYRNKMNDDTFKIVARFARLNYVIRLDKDNINYSHFKREPENDEFIMTRKNVNVIGITVGDLLKHYYHCNKNKKDIILSDNENENMVMLKHIKKSLLIETSNAKLTDVLGKYHFKKRTVKLWNSLIPGKFIDQGDSNFAGFCNKIIFLSEGMFKFIFVSKSEKDVLEFNDKYYRNIFNNLSDKIIVQKLLRYHLYNEDPEAGLYTETIYFEEPTLVPDILQYLFEKYNDLKYIDEYNAVMKTLNAGQSLELEKRYKPAIFRSIQNVNDEYPIYAFRNIYLQQWKFGDSWDLMFHHNDYMMSIKNQKYKHKCKISDKVIPVEKRFFNDRSYYRYMCAEDNKKLLKNYSQTLIKEGLQDYNDYYT